MKMSKTSLVAYVQLVIVIMAAAAVLFTDTTMEIGLAVALGVNQILTIFGLIASQDQTGTSIGGGGADTGGN